MDVLYMYVHNRDQGPSHARRGGRCPNAPPGGTRPGRVRGFNHDAWKRLKSANAFPELAVGAFPHLLRFAAGSSVRLPKPADPEILRPTEPAED